MDTKSTNRKYISSFYRIICTCLILITNFSIVLAQSERIIQNDHPPLDSTIRFGRLSNGFKYFIKPVDSSPFKINMRLYNNAGANQENPDQLNIAHAVEHMAFKATVNFPSGVNNSESIDKLNMGMMDIKGSNGPKSTQYGFNVPYGDTEALNMGLIWFKDILTGLKLDNSDIDQVRGELRQEFLLKNGDDLDGRYARAKLYANLFPCKKEYSSFFDHHETFKPETLKRFYKDWYRPDLSAISIVGKIDDPVGLEKIIIKTFSNITSHSENRSLLDCDSDYFHRPPQFIQVELKKDSLKANDNKAVNIHLIFRAPTIQATTGTMEGVEQLIKLKMVADIVNERFKEITMEYGSFSVYGRDLYTYNDMPPAIEIVITLENQSEQESLERTILVLQRLQKYGINERELNKMKKMKFQYFEPNRIENVNYWNNEIKNYFIHGEALPIEKLDSLRTWLTNLSLDELNGFTRELFTKKPEDIGIISFSGHKALSYTEKEVRSWVDAIFQKDVKAYEKPKIPKMLMSQAEVNRLKIEPYLTKGKGESGAQEVILGNGTKVVLKTVKSHSKIPDEIHIHGFSLKGANRFSRQLYASAISAPAIVKNAGVNGLNKYELTRSLSHTKITPGSVSTYIDEQESGIHAKATLEDIEPLLQLIYLNFTKPNKDLIAFEDWKSEEKKAYQKVSIDSDFNNAISEYTGNNFLRKSLIYRIPDGTKRYKNAEKANIDIAYKIYNTLFGNAQDFTFIITGDFNVDSILPTIQKYLGNIPNLKSAKRNITMPIIEEESNLAPGPSYLILPTPDSHKVRNIKYSINFIQKADIMDDWREKLKVEALAEIVSQKAWKLRFEKDFSLYLVGVFANYNEDLGRIEIASKFECVPEEYPQIRKEFKQIVLEIKSGVISNKEFQEGMRRIYTTYLSERANLPFFRQQKLYKHYRYGIPWIEQEVIDRYLKSLTEEDIVNTAKKYFRKENLYEFVIMNNEI